MFERKTLLIIAAFIGLPYFAVSAFEMVWTPSNLRINTVSKPSEEFSPEQLAILAGADPTTLLAPTGTGGNLVDKLLKPVACSVGGLKTSDPRLIECDNYMAVDWHGTRHIHLFCGDEMKHAELNDSNALTLSLGSHDDQPLELALANIDHCSNRPIEIGTVR